MSLSIITIDKLVTIRTMHCLSLIKCQINDFRHCHKIIRDKLVSIKTMYCLSLILLLKQATSIIYVKVSLVCVGNLRIIVIKFLKSIRLKTKWYSRNHLQGISLCLGNKDKLSIKQCRGWIEMKCCWSEHIIIIYFRNEMLLKCRYNYYFKS